MNTTIDLLLAIEQHFAESYRVRGCELHQTGPWHLVRWLDAPVEWFNHATAEPSADVEQALSLLPEVIRFYQQSSLPAVVEVSHELTPGLEEAMYHQGWIYTGTTPLMVWQATSLPQQSNSELRIRQVSPQQIDLYARTSLAGYGESLEEYGWLVRQTERNEQVGNPAYLGWLDNTPVATVEIVFSPQAAEITNVTTLPEYRRQGIGSRMVNHAIRAAQKQGKAIIFLSAQDHWSQRLYERLGFHTIGWVSNFHRE